ncbi:MAG TPA: aminotransferase class I/II-fold pyridoxal phosphate-dependent enzyme [Candidatus Kapabacteria bacterium]|nr:aminotransferase class I/II-fold pyridoxal phosphate-dependent enzyme [Candidatus Kapabacteria bacterium]
MSFRFLKKPIFTGFEPNATWRDVSIASSYLFFPWKWVNLRYGKSGIKAKAWLQSYFKGSNAFLLDSGRSALFVALKALDIKPGDEVLIQGYTCVVVTNAIRWAGGIPVYVDVQNDFNMDPTDLQKKITEKSKILIIQHTFGVPAPVKQLLTIAEAHNIRVIEDCAHSLGTMYDDQLTGTLGDIGMFSFGSDKVVSCVRGGALITKDNTIALRIDSLLQRLYPSPRLLIIRQLLHYPIFAFSKPLYWLGVGKIVLGFAKKIHLTTRIISEEEKRGKQLLPYPTLLPNALADVLCNQLEQLDKINRHRQTIAEKYSQAIQNKHILPNVQKGSIYLRYPLLVSNPDVLHAKAKKEGIILGDWYTTVIAPKDILESGTGYQNGSCPNAEVLSKKSLNLPTHQGIREVDIERIVRIINTYTE